MCLIKFCYSPVVVHLTTPGESSPIEDLQECVQNLFTTDEDEENKSQKPRILWSSYFSIPDTNDQKFKEALPKNIFPCPGPDTDLDYDLSVKKVCINRSSALEKN